MKTIAVIGLAVFLILMPALVVTCDSNEDSLEDIGIKTLPEGYSWYQNDEFGYKIAYPEDWTVIPHEVPRDGMDHIQEFRDPDGFGRITVYRYYEYDLNMFKDWEQEDVLINGRKGYEVIDWGTTPKIKTVVFVNKDKLWAIVCTTPRGLWDEYASTFDNAICTIVIE